MSRFIVKITLFFISILVTILILIFIQPILYKVLQSDSNRHLVLQNYFNQNAQSDNGEVILFGDSRSMFGVDTRIVKNQLNLSKEVYNLSSVGQNIYESSYYYTHVKDNIKMIIQCTSPAFFSRNIEHNLPDSKAISMYLSGYRVDEPTKKLIPNYNPFFDRSALVNYYESKSYFKTYIHVLLRPLFDNEVFDESSRSSKYFPHLYTKDKVPQYPAHVVYNCDGYVSKEKPESQTDFIAKSVKYFKARHMKYVLILMPVNSDVCSEGYDDFRKYADDLSQIEGISVINLSELLKPEFFYDGTHSNKAGAKIISSEISKQIKLLMN